MSHNYDTIRQNIRFYLLGFFYRIDDMPPSEASAVYAPYLGMVWVAHYYNLCSVCRRGCRDGMNLLYKGARRVNNFCPALIYFSLFIRRNPVGADYHIYIGFYLINRFNRANAEIFQLFRHIAVVYKHSVGNGLVFALRRTPRNLHGSCHAEAKSGFIGYLCLHMYLPPKAVISPA